MVDRPMTLSRLRDATAETFRTLLSLDESPAIRAAVWFPGSRSLTDAELSASIAGTYDADFDATFELNPEDAILVQARPETVYAGFPTGSRVSYVLAIAAIVAAARLGEGLVAESYDLWPEIGPPLAPAGYDPVDLLEHLRLQAPEPDIQAGARRLLSVTNLAEDEWPGEDVPYE